MRQFQIQCGARVQLSGNLVSCPQKRAISSNRQLRKSVLWRRPCAPSDRTETSTETLSLTREPHVETRGVDLVERRGQEWVDSRDAVLAHGLFFTVLVCGSFPAFYGYTHSQVPYFLSLATLSIYIGAHRSLDTDAVEQLTFKESLLAPVFASVALFGFYLLMKYYPGFSIQTLIDWQFGLLGTFAVGRLVAPFLERLPQLSSLQWEIPREILHDKDNKAVSLSGADLLAGIIGCGCVLLDLSYGHHMHSLNNLLACSIAIELLQGMGIKSFKVAAVLLLGLLTYDVFWVFLSPSVVGENVMLSVATSNSIEGPLKLLLPNGNSDGAYPFSILGLGDIAVPGLLAALMLRLDIFGKLPTERPLQPEPEAEDDMGICYSMESISLPQSEAVPDLISAQQNGSPAASESNREGGLIQSRTYFLPVLGAYVTGLLLAFLAGNITQAGQPALLYIVPCMLTTSIGLAVAREEFWELLFSYKDPVKHSLQNKQKTSP